MAIENDQILLYYHFNKIIKGPGTSLKSPALSQNNVCLRSSYYLTKFILIVFRIQKNKCNFHYVAMSMMTPVNFTKTQKFRYLKNRTFFLQK